MIPTDPDFNLITTVQDSGQFIVPGDGKGKIKDHYVHEEIDFSSHVEGGSVFRIFPMDCEKMRIADSSSQKNLLCFSSLGFHPLVRENPPKMTNEKMNDEFLRNLPSSVLETNVKPVAWEGTNFFDNDENFGIEEKTHINSILTGPTTRKHVGTIIDGTKQKLICPSFGENEEMNLSDLSDSDSFHQLFENFHCFPLVDASSLRAFHFGGEWHLSTTERIDAFTCRWRHFRDSFGVMFVNCLPEASLLEMLIDEDQMNVQNSSSSALPLSKSSFRLNPTIPIFPSNLTTIEEYRNVFKKWAEKNLIKDFVYFFLITQKTRGMLNAFHPKRFFSPDHGHSSFRINGNIKNSFPEDLTQSTLPFSTNPKENERLFLSAVFRIVDSDVVHPSVEMIEKVNVNHIPSVNRIDRDTLEKICSAFLLNSTRKNIHEYSFPDSSASAPGKDEGDCFNDREKKTNSNDLFEWFSDADPEDPDRNLQTTLTTLFGLFHHFNWNGLIFFPKTHMSEFKQIRLLTPFVSKASGLFGKTTDPMSWAEFIRSTECIELRKKREMAMATFFPAWVLDVGMINHCAFVLDRLNVYFDLFKKVFIEKEKREMFPQREWQFLLILEKTARKFPSRTTMTMCHVTSLFNSLAVRQRIALLKSPFCQNKRPLMHLEKLLPRCFESFGSELSSSSSSSRNQYSNCFPPHHTFSKLPRQPPNMKCESFFSPTTTTTTTQIPSFISSSHRHSQETNRNPEFPHPPLPSLHHIIPSQNKKKRNGKNRRRNGQQPYLTVSSESETPIASSDKKFSSMGPIQSSDRGSKEDRVSSNKQTGYKLADNAMESYSTAAIRSKEKCHAIEDFCSSQLEDSFPLLSIN